MSYLEKQATRNKAGANPWPETMTEKGFFLLVVSCILTLTIVVYANSFRNDFTNWDDKTLVLENPSIRSLSVSNLIDIFTPKREKTYQPIRVLSYAIDYRLWKFNPVGYHLGNTALHCFSAVILYLLSSSILQQIRGKDFAESNRAAAFIAALLFTVHPVNVESVAWIASRKYGLLAAFYLLSFYLFVRSGEKGARVFGFYLLSLISFVLALLSSPFSVTLPALLYLYDYCRYTQEKAFQVLKKRFFYYLPYGLLSVLQFSILMNVLSKGPQGTIKTHLTYNPIYTLLTMLRALFDYVFNLILPFWLNNWYGASVPKSLLDAKAITAFGVILLILGILRWQIRLGRKMPLFCFGWFFITLLPASNIIPISTKVADRYLYLPAAGLFLLFSLTLCTLATTWFPKKLKPFMTMIIVALLLMPLAYLTVQRNRVWANTITLWSDSIRTQANNRTAHLNLGQALSEQGRLDEAITHFQEALRLSPNYAEAHNNLGTALVQKGKLDMAVPHFYTALRILPDFGEAHNNLAVALARQGRLEEATKHYSAAAQLNPSSAEVHNNLAVALARLGKIDEAMSHYAKAVELRPDYAEAYNNFGNALAAQGSLDEAIVHYSRALEINPQYAKAHNNLGVVLARQGRLNKAIAHFSEAVQLDPQFLQAQNNLALALQEANKLDQMSGPRLKN